MNKLNAIIIEDEVPAARLLHSMITRLRPQWTLTIIPGSVDEAVAWFKDNPQPDLIFLDIQLADGNAFDFLSAVHPSSIIIFTTAYDQYAIRAFTVNSIDYILKPIYKPQNKMFHFCKTFCSKITLVNTIQNVILNPI